MCRKLDHIDSNTILDMSLSHRHNSKYYFIHYPVQDIQPGHLFPENKITMLFIDF